MVAVFMGEDGKHDALDAGAVGVSPLGRVRRRTSRKRRSMAFVVRTPLRSVGSRKRKHASSPGAPPLKSKCQFRS